MSEPVLVYKVTRSSRRRAMVMGALGLMLLLVGVAVVYGSAWGAGLAGLFATVGFARAIVPVETPVMRLDEEGVHLYEGGRKKPRILPWSTVSGVSVREAPREHGHARHLLVFRLMALERAYLLPVGSPPPEVLAEAVRARIRPEVAGKGDSMDAAAFFQTVFHLRLPDTAKVLHAEFHPDDRSGWWAVGLAEADFLALRTTAGEVSAWYPLMRDQRFEVGGRRLVGTVDLDGEYAISRADWDSTPVLVWDASRRVLHGLLTRSTG